MLQSQKHHFIVLLTIFLQFSSLLLQSSGYTLPDHYFINCGSDSNATYGGNKVFVGDSSFFSGQNQAIKDDSNTSSVLYQTARVFHGDRSSYHLEIKETATHIVRLHFFAFSSAEANLSDALFNVRADEFSLLSNFSISQSSNSPVKEFLLTIPTGIFRIQFIPSKSSFAFVNAIEVFFAPENIIPDYALNKSGLPSYAVQTIYRINVGGSKLTAENDTLLREWIPDKDFLLNSEAETSSPPAKNVTFLLDMPANEYIAPASVYKTVRALNLSGNSNVSSIRWRFSVRKNASYLVRFHFHDIIVNPIDSLHFNLHIYNFTKYISPFDLGYDFRTPFFLDFIVDSEDSGFMNISIASMEDTKEKEAFLNGLEIMELTNFDLPPYKQKNHPPFVVIGSVCGAASVIILIMLFLIDLKCRKSNPRKAFAAKSEASHSWIAKKPGSTSAVPNLNLKLKMPLAEILAATENFDSKFLIGEGGFGKVYKGTLQGGKKVAVKRSDSSYGQGIYEFQTEVLVLSKMRHRHLVSLIGYCDDGNEMILVYEFMEKGTLRDHLYNWKENSKKNIHSKTPKLTWKQRLEICIGSAKGLHYLHSGSDGRIIHRDVKSSNILLDEDNLAKVADFGLSRSGPSSTDHFSTNVKGSFGYIDPEYFKTCQLTDKSDVYSFGVVLLEVLCARPPIINSPQAQSEEINLAEWAMYWLKKGQLEKIIDPSLVGHIKPNSLKTFGKIAEKCLKREGADRPTMLDVCWDLEYALQLQQTAVHRETDQGSSTFVTTNITFSIQHLGSNIFTSQEGGVLIEGDNDS